MKDAGKQTEWYKRELLAREEAYNHRFHKDPVKVGTMDLPLVPKNRSSANVLDNQSEVGSAMRDRSAFRSTNTTTKLPHIQK